MPHHESCGIAEREDTDNDQRKGPSEMVDSVAERHTFVFHMQKYLRKTRSNEI